VDLRIGFSFFFLFEKKQIAGLKDTIVRQLTRCPNGVICPFGQILFHSDNIILYIGKLCKVLKNSSSPSGRALIGRIKERPFGCLAMTLPFLSLAVWAESWKGKIKKSPSC